jgi:hypothetical protein
MVDRRSGRTQKENSIKLNIKQAKNSRYGTNIVESDKHYWYDLASPFGFCR